MLNVLSLDPFLQVSQGKQKLQHLLCRQELYCHKSAQSHYSGRRSQLHTTLYIANKQPAPNSWTVPNTPYLILQVAAQKLFALMLTK